MKTTAKCVMLICFSCRSRSNEMSELIVVTIVVASEGGVKVPKVSSREELKTALNKLGALRSEQVCCVVCCTMHTVFHVLSGLPASMQCSGLELLSRFSEKCCFYHTRLSVTQHLTVL